MKRRLLSILMALVLVLGLAAPVGAAEKAAVIRLTKTTGTVKISKSSGKTLSLLTNMRLHNGYHVTTAKGSYAWLNLDDAKLLKEDAASEVEVRQSGKKLEVKVWSGSVFFNVTEKLADDESLNISTSTMIVGIRGTSGYVQVVDRWTTLLTVLEGTVECSVSDPVTGQIKTEEIHGGETVKCVVYPQDQPGDKCDILRDKLTTGGIPGFVLTELVRDIPLCDKIQEATGVDIPRDLATVAGGDPSGRQPDGETATPEVLGEAERQEELDESALQEKLDEVAASQGGQEGNVSGDKALPKQPTGGGGGGGYTGGGGGGSDPTPAPSTKPENMMPLTIVEVQALLDGADNVTIQASGNSADNTLTIDSDLTVAAGKTLTLDPGIGVTVEAGKALQVDGTMTADNITNNGAVTVTSSNTLRLRGNFDGAGGTLAVPATGRVVVDGTLSWGTLNLTPGATVMAKNKGSGTPPIGWSWSAAADSSGYYILVYADPYTMPLTWNQVRALLDKDKNVTIKANVDPAKNTLTTGTNVPGIFEQRNVGSGETLTLEPGIGITILGASVEVGGTLTVDSINNSFGQLAVTMGGTLHLRESYKGALTVSGTVVVDGTPEWSSLSLAGNWATVKAKGKGGTLPVGWSWSAAADSSGYYTLIYTAPTYAVTFDANGGTFQVGDASDVGQSIVQTGEDGKIPAGNWPTDPTNGSFTFEGWYFGTGANAAKAEQSHVFTSDITVYAHWSGYSYDETTKTLTLVTVPASNPTGDNTFWSKNKTQIEHVVILDGADSIGNSAFNGCTSLQSVTIPESVTSIGASAFNSCASLQNVTIPDSVESIGGSAFYNCKGLTSIALPSKLTRIETNTFWGCSSLTNIVMPAGITSIGGYAFVGTGFQSIELPDSVTDIGERAFANCKQLASITFPSGNNPVTIGEYAFYECIALTGDLVIPGNVSTIGAHAFRGCTGLTSAVFSEGVTTIGMSIFFDCSKLTSITVPDTVTSIDSNAFLDNVQKLATINFGGTTARWTELGVTVGGSVTIICTDGTIPDTP